MSEEVATGGIKKFSYEKGYQPTLTNEEKREIEEAYRKADERKKIEQRRRKIQWIIISIVIAAILILLAVLFLRRS